MKLPTLLVLVLVLVLDAGAALLTPRAATVPKSTPMRQAAIIPADPDNLAVSVTANEYLGYTNVELVIDAKTGLLLSWHEKFHGPTNSFHFRGTNQMEFYRAHYRYAGTTN